MTEERKLQAGGALRPQRDIYIERPEDEAFFKLLLASEYVNVLSPRQMGKSSLMVRTIGKLQAEGVRTANVDVAADLTGTLEADRWFLALVREIARKLDIQFDVSTWWRAHEDDALGQRLQRFFREVVLEQIPPPVRIVVFLDEIDNTLSYPFTDSLFTAIRGMYNERSLDPRYDRVAFCLIGVATPNELIKDRRSTAYNVGRTLALRDFDATRDDLCPLVDALSGDPTVGRVLLDRVLYWTGGQPLLTVKCCAALAESRANAIEAVDDFVDHNFNKLDRVRTDIHFQQILRFVEMRFSAGYASLKLYGRVLQQAKVKAETTLPHLQLELSGLVKRDDAGFFVLRNRLYTQLFDQDWLNSTRAMRQVSRYRIVASVAGIVAALALGGAGYVEYRAYKYQAAIKSVGDLVDLSGNDAYGYRLTFGKSDGSRAGKGDPSKNDQAFFDSIVDAFPDKGKIRGVDLSGRDVHDLSKVALLKDLSYLWLWSVPARDLQSLSGLEKLEVLSIASMHISDITPLSRLFALKRLFAWGNSFSDISPLQNLINLEFLRLNDLPIRNIHALSKLKKLNELDLRGDQIDDLTPLSELWSLETLIISVNRIDDLTPLRNLRNLRSVTIVGVKSGRIGDVFNTEAIQLLNLHGAIIDDWNGLANFTSLTDLDLSRSNFIKLDSLCPSDTLENLYLGDTKVVDLSPLEKCSKLSRIELSGTPVTDLRPLQKLRKLEIVGLANTKIGDGDIVAFRKTFSPGNDKLQVARKTVGEMLLEIQQQYQGTRNQGERNSSPVN
jgi:hypothetical protein